MILHPTPRFQSTLSARRATFFRRCFCPCCKNFNPRSPRGERRTNSFAAILCMVISIHALREESDFRVALHFAPWRLSISIHALREESDCISFKWYSSHKRNFNPRSPRGERLSDFDHMVSHAEFQSTLSARRATSQRVRHGYFPSISIHALREESDIEIALYCLD